MYRLELIIYGVEEDNEISLSLNSWEQAHVLISLIVGGMGWTPNGPSIISEGYYGQGWEEGHLSIRERYVDTSII